MDMPHPATSLRTSPHRTTSAARAVPRCKTASNRIPGRGIPRRASAKMRWAVLLTGKNSVSEAQDDHIQHVRAPLKGAMLGASECSTQHVLCPRRALLQYRYQRASQASQKVFPVALTVRGPTSSTPVRPSNDASRSGVASSTWKVTGGENASGFGHRARFSNASAARVSISVRASTGARWTAENRPRPFFTGAVTTVGPMSSRTSVHVASSPATKTAGTFHDPAMAATMPDSPTGVPLMVARYHASDETVWDKTPPGVPALACAPTNNTASHPWVSGSTYLAQAWPRT